MHCRACDDLISDKEASRKSPTTGEYYDLCDECFGTIADQVEVSENPLVEQLVKENEENEQAKDSPDHPV